MRRGGHGDNHGRGSGDVADKGVRRQRGMKPPGWAELEGRCRRVWWFGFEGRILVEARAGG